MISKYTKNKIIESFGELVGTEVINRLSTLSDKNLILQGNVQSIDRSAEMASKISVAFRAKMSNYHLGNSGIKIAENLNKIDDRLSGKNILLEPMDKIDLEAMSLALNSVDAAKEFKTIFNKICDNLNGFQPEAAVEVPVIQEVSAPVVDLVEEKPQEKQYVVKRIRLKTTNRSDLF